MKYYCIYIHWSLCAFPRRGRAKQHLSNDHGEMCYHLRENKKKYLSEVEAKFEDQCIAKRNEPA